MAFQISIHRRHSDIDLIYHEPILLHKNYEVALQTFVTYNSIPNVSEALRNNKLHVFLEINLGMKDQETLSAVIPIEEQEPLSIVIPDGTYKLKDLIHLIMDDPLASTANLSLALNKNTMKVHISCKNAMIDFTQEDSLGQLLGFSKKRKIWSREEYSDLLIDINPINTIRVQCNLVKSNIHDLDRNDHTIYEFPLDVDPGERIVERPSNLLYYGINTDAIHELNIRVTDQSGNLIDFRGERVTLILSFRPVL